MRLSSRLVLCVALLLTVVAQNAPAAEAPDLILHHGKIVTVDADFSIREAIAIKDGRIAAVGSSEEVLRSKGPQTKVVDLGGKAVLPGLMDTHVHATGAAMHEFDHPVPDMETIQDVLDYIKSRATALGEGKWVVVRQVFITRLKEQRYPTKAELDAVAPKNPVVFSTGPDASVNSLALKESGIDRDFQATGSGRVERDPSTGEPTGILRSASQYLKIKAQESKATSAQQDERLLALFADYNSVGLTGVIDRNAGDGAVERYKRLATDGKSTVRMRISYAVGTSGKVEAIQEDIRKVAANPLCKGDDMVRIIGIKTFLDGGMLTGSAYMREPWGVSQIYSITDPMYRGLLYIPDDKLLPIVQTTVENGLQFTAHSVGDGAVHSLLNAYEQVNKLTPIAATRPCITHSNFMSREAVEQACRLGVQMDIQPAWLYLDAHTLAAQFGYDRLRYFQPLKSIFASGGVVGGGSDHMQKVGSLRSINPYNPFLAMWVAVSRKSRYYDRPLHPEEALTREQAIRFYTINNAKLMFLEDKVGSLESGKLADLVVLDRDLLTCPEDEMRNTQAVATYLGGKLVYEKK